MGGGRPTVLLDMGRPTVLRDGSSVRFTRVITLGLLNEAPQAALRGLIQETQRDRAL
jgi:hypothetical protein